MRCNNTDCKSHSHSSHNGCRKYVGVHNCEDSTVGPSVKTLAQTYKESTNAFDIQHGGSHYKGMKIQPMEFALANNLNYGQANAIKYICRYANKNGEEDLKKAIHCIQLLMEHEYGQEDI